MNTTQSGLLVIKPKGNIPQDTTSGAGAGSVIVSTCALPSVVFATGGYGAAGNGDITGNNHGGSGAAAAVVGSIVAQIFTTIIGPRGGIKRKVHSRRRRRISNVKADARTVGSPLFGGSSLFGESEFDCPLFENKRAWLFWCTGKRGGRPGDDLATRLLDIGKRAASRQARRILNLRGVRCSDTSKEDAASDAVLNILRRFKFDKVTESHWTQPRFVRTLAIFAGRGAFNSLASWSSLGMRGDTNRFRKGNAKQTLQELTAELIETLADEVEPERESIKESRFQILRWLYRVGFQEFKATLRDRRGAALAINAARARCRVVGNVILGASLQDACAVSSFASLKSFKQSCEASGFWESLQAARWSNGDAAHHIRMHRARMRYHAKQAADYIRAMRALSAALPVADIATGSTQRHMRPSVKSDIALVRQWRKVASLRGHHVARAVYYRNAAAVAHKADGAAYERVLVGIKSGTFGNLRGMVGLTVKRKHAGKVNPLLIGKPSGKLPTVKVEPAMVALPVGRYNRNMPCAVLA